MNSARHRSKAARAATARAIPLTPTPAAGPQGTGHIPAKYWATQAQRQPVNLTLGQITKLRRLATPAVPLATQVALEGSL